MPRAPPAKYLSKAANGFRHSYVFTLGDVQVVRIKPSSQRILDANCAACHARMVAELRPDRAAGPKFCFECHQGAGHGF